MSIKIQIIEDELLIAEGIKESLVSEGYAVTGITSNYADAVALAMRDKPDLAIVDIVIDGSKDGIETAAAFTKVDIPVIFLTANSDLSYLQKIKDSRSSVLITKPFHTIELITNIEISLLNHRHKNELKASEEKYKKLAAKLANQVEQRKQAEIKLAELNLLLEEKVIKAVAENVEKERMLQLSAKSAALGEMIANIAHQWRQPLNNISLHITDLKEAYDNNELDETYINNTTSQLKDIIQLLSQTIDDFKDFYIENKSEDTFSIGASIIKALSFVNASYQFHFINYSFDRDTDFLVSGNKNQFIHVLLNILNNAKDALVAHNRSDKSVKIKLSKIDNFAEIVISDNAGGIEEKNLPQVFTRYFTTKKGSHGTGLGLYMARTIVQDLFKGTIEARNSSQGADFIIRIPISISEETLYY